MDPRPDNRDQRTENLEATSNTGAGRQGLNRRSVLGTGAKLAFAAPAVVAALQLSTAFADDESETRKRRQRAIVRRVFTSFFAHLCRASDVPATDFATKPSRQDPLGHGDLSVLDEQNQLLVHLHGAEANATYEVRFVPFSNQTPVVLGSVTTDANGNVFARVPLPSSFGSDRTGIFVFARTGGGPAAGQGEVQFVVCLNDHNFNHDGLDHVFNNDTFEHGRIVVTQPVIVIEEHHEHHDEEEGGDD